MSSLEPYGQEEDPLVPSRQKQDNSDVKQLYESMSSLTQSMQSMMGLFRTAAEQMQIEDKEQQTFSEQLKPVMEKIDEIIEQNKIIAEGMIALSDLVKERIPDKAQGRPVPQPNFGMPGDDSFGMPPSFGQPPQMPGMGPPPMQGMPGMGMPPQRGFGMPPPEEKKKSFWKK